MNAYETGRTLRRANRRNRVRRFLDHPLTLILTAGVTLATVVAYMASMVQR